MRKLALLFAVLIGFPAISGGQQLMVLKDTGTTSEGLPVVMPHSASKSFEAPLDRGFSRQLVQLDWMVQQYLFSKGKGPTPEPLYLVLTRNQGGFPRKGFVFNGTAKRSSWWVDLPEGQTVTGNWGAMDQIFPHELAHVIMARLVHEHGASVPVQTHAVGVRTSPEVAFEEGFGEHAQIMAVDDPGADPATKELAHDPYWHQRVTQQLAAYRREMMAHVSFASPMRLTFPLWFSGAEQYMRYQGVKDNAFARRPSICAEDSRRCDLYNAYLLDRVLPGTAQDEPRSAVQMIETEGVVSHIFWRWVNSREIGGKFRERSFYLPFGVTPEELSSSQNSYLKIFVALEHSQAHDMATLIHAYRTLFPDEQGWLDQIVKEALLGQELPITRPIWIANTQWQVGTTIFDQWRSLPQDHYFDLNAADDVDLATIPGLSRASVAALRGHAPYSSWAELAQVPGISELDITLLRKMEFSSSGPRSDDDLTLANSLRAMVVSYAWRAFAAWLCAALIGAVALRFVEPWSWCRALWRSALGSGSALLLVWMGPIGIPGGVWTVWALTAALAALWRLRPSVKSAVPVQAALRGLSAPVRGILAWGVTLFPAWILSRPW
jgi:hypothetical protein